MPETLIKVDLAQSPYENEGVHNRWHPDIRPALRVDPGDTVALETRDAFDGAITPDMTVADFHRIDLNVVHPLTGPVFINGAEPGDVLDRGPIAAAVRPAADWLAAAPATGPKTFVSSSHLEWGNQQRPAPPGSRARRRLGSARCSGPVC